MLKTFQPKSNLLQKYIDFFYVFERDRSEKISYIAFPHVNTAISFFKGAAIQRGDYELSIIAASQNKDECIVEILGKYIQPVFVNYLGHCEEVAVVFKPLGVNHFFQSDLIELAPIFSQELNDELWTEFCYVLLNENNVTTKIEMLETFLLDNLKERDVKKIYDAIIYLEDFETNYAIDKIATLNGFTLKTFQRNFTKHLTCSPSEYKRIARFRHSLKNKLISKELKTLTSLSNDSNYYDQSYFIREYKKLTQQNPKGFFSSITALDEKNIVWKLR